MKLVLLLLTQLVCQCLKKTTFNLHLPQLNECQVNKAILIFKETIYLQKKEKTPCRHLPTAQLT